MIFVVHLTASTFHHLKGSRGRRSLSPKGRHMARRDPLAGQCLKTASLKATRAGLTANRYVPGASDARREWVANEGRKPFAAVLSCADSRVPPELLFDRGWRACSWCGWLATASIRWARRASNMRRLTSGVETIPGTWASELRSGKRRSSPLPAGARVPIDGLCSNSGGGRGYSQTRWRKIQRIKKL